MQRLSTLIKFNLKKSFKDYLSFASIILLAATVAGIAITIEQRADKIYAERYQELNTAELNLLLPESEATKGLKSRFGNLQKNKSYGIKEFETHEALLAEVIYIDFAGSDFAMNTVFYNADEAREINRFKILNGDSNYQEKSSEEEISADQEKTETEAPFSQEKSAEGLAEREENHSLYRAYLPLYMHKLGGYNQGEKIKVELPKKSGMMQFTYLIEEMQYGNYASAQIAVYLPDDEFKNMQKESDVVKALEFSFKMQQSDTQPLQRKIHEELKADNISIISLNTADQIKQGRMQVANIISLILKAFAILILILDCFLLNFKIKMQIKEEMPQLGVMKALGYSSYDLQSAIISAYLFVALIAFLPAAALTYLLLPAISEFLSMQSGMSLNISFDFSSFALTFLLIVLPVILFAAVAVRSIKNHEVVNAIRNIKATHAVSSKAYKSVKGSKLSVKRFMILKEVGASKGRNFLLSAQAVIAVMLLTFAATFFYNGVIKPENLINTLQEESPDIIINCPGDEKDALKSKLGEEKALRKLIEYSIVPIEAGEFDLNCFVCDDFKKLENDICYKGRMPETAFETAIGSILTDEYTIGDKITLTDDYTQEFEITGFIQSVNMAGKVAALNGQGFAEISNKDLNSLYLYLNEEYSNAGKVEMLLASFEKNYDEIVNSQNNRKMFEKSAELFSGIVKTAALAIVIFSTAVIIFLIYMLINSLIASKEEEYGIFKALGYSSSQLISQAVLPFMPVIAISSIISGSASIYYIPLIFKTIFSSLGAYKNRLMMPPLIAVITTFSFILFCFLISAAMAARIKKISAYDLIKE